MCTGAHACHLCDIVIDILLIFIFTNIYTCIRICIPNYSYCTCVYLYIVIYVYVNVCPYGVHGDISHTFLLKYCIQNIWHVFY